MYTIHIKQSKEIVMGELLKFGEPDRKFLKPRFVKIHRIHGNENEVGCVIRYEIFNRLLYFDLELEKVINNQIMIYKVKNGFAKGGVLLFEIVSGKVNTTKLSVYVGFNFKKGSNPISYFYWKAFRYLFPFFVHDVIWNNSLCKLKDISESL